MSSKITKVAKENKGDFKDLGDNKDDKKLDLESDGNGDGF
jgi:hypothetical protein